jgi:hypothetical protein
MSARKSFRKRPESPVTGWHRAEPFGQLEGVGRRVPAVVVVEIDVDVAARSPWRNATGDATGVSRVAAGSARFPS